MRRNKCAETETKRERERVGRNVNETRAHGIFEVDAKKLKQSKMFDTSVEYENCTIASGQNASSCYIFVHALARTHIEDYFSDRTPNVTCVSLVCVCSNAQRSRLSSMECVWCRLKENRGFPSTSTFRRAFFLSATWLYEAFIWQIISLRGIGQKSMPIVGMIVAECSVGSGKRTQRTHIHTWDVNEMSVVALRRPSEHLQVSRNSGRSKNGHSRFTVKSTRKIPIKLNLNTIQFTTIENSKNTFLFVLHVNA